MKFTKIIILVGWLLLSNQFVCAFPTQFRRLIWEENGRIIKTVDFIYDTHIEVQQPTARTPQVPRYGISPEEWPQLAIAERTLLNALRTMAEKPGEKIGLLWEFDTPSPGLGKSIFMSSSGTKLYEEFAANKNKRLIFISSDTYRNSNNDLGIRVTEVLRGANNNILRNFKIGSLDFFFDLVSNAGDI